jgi:hypothetical protein
MASQSSLINYGLQAGEKQIIPDYTRFENPTRQSVILERSKVAYVPVSGQQYTVGGTSGNSTQMSFLISDASRFLDLPTAFLAFDYALTRTDTPASQTGSTLPSDGGVALFNRCQVKLNGILLEDVTQLNQAFHARMVTSMNKDYYENQHDILSGSWLWNQSYGGAQVGIADITTRLRAAEKTSYVCTYNGTGGATTTTASRSFAIPLGFLAGLFTKNGLLPLPLMNTLEINFFFDNVLNSHYCVDSATPAISYTLSNVRIVTDMCEMNSAYGQLLKQICYQDPEGLNMSFDTLQSFALSYSATSGIRSTNQLVFNKASPFVRSILCSKIQASSVNVANQLPVINFINGGNQGVRISVGSVYQPLMGDTQNNATTYAVLRGQDIQNVISGGVQNGATYSGFTWAGVAATASVADSLLSNFTFGFDFDKSRGEVDKDGIDSSALGSAFVVYNTETSTTTESRLLNVHIHYTRHLCMRGGVLSVSG